MLFSSDFQDFSGVSSEFQDFLGLENNFLKFKDFPGYVRTLQLAIKLSFSTFTINIYDGQDIIVAWLLY